MEYATLLKHTLVIAAVVPLLGGIALVRSGHADHNPDSTETGIREGMVAPDFTLPDQAGTEYTLSQFRGEKNVVLYFYPKDDTPGCTKEACNFRDDFSVFDSLQTVVLGVSVDDVDSHREFADKYKLNFPLLADTEKKVSRTYGVLAFYGKSKRHTFLIDKEGVIRKIYTKVDVEKHPEEVARFIRENMEE